MGLLTLIPGDKAIHLPSDTRVEINGYADGNFTAVILDAGDRVTGQRITAPVTEFVAPAHPAVAAPRASAAPSSTLPSPCNGEGPGVGFVPRIEVRVERNISEKGLARFLNDGWAIIHMQFMIAPIGADDVVSGNDALHVVLQRTVTAPPPQPEARAAVVRTVTGTVVPVPHVGDDDEYDDVPPALDPEPKPDLVPPPLHAMGRGLGVGTLGGGDFTRAVLSARLSPAQTLELLNNRLKSVAREAYNAAPAPLPYMPLGVSK